MSSRNNNGEMMGIAIVIVIISFMFLAIYALLLFAAFILTILSVIAWNNPLKLGSHILEPHEARAFILRGIIGMFALPFFGAFCEFIFEIRIEEDYWPHLFLAGYALGSLGIEILMAKDEENTTTTVLPPQVPPPPLPRKPQGLPPGEPFHFASWDDEERE